MNNADLFWRIFSRRSALCLFVMLLLFFSCILRLAVTASGAYTEAAAEQNRLKITVKKQRGTIYDCKLTPLTNNKASIIACVSPTPKAITAVSRVLKNEALKELLEKLREGKPALAELTEEISCDGIVCTTVKDTDRSENGAEHILGYTDSESHGVTGLEAAYDKLLYSDGEIYFSYECNGKGKILEGIKPETVNDASVEASGPISTIDINIQSVAEKAADSLEAGAVIVAEAESGKIRALVSRPGFDISKISEYLDSADSPLLNRALNAYNVGSVFKPCVAAAGIENSKGSFTYNCLGGCKIADRIFKCHKYDGHGLMNLRSATANSCNTFFYNFGLETGGKEILKTAAALRFGKSLKLCDGIYTKAGCLPTAEALENSAQLANFSIGQGELLLSPVSMLTLYCAIATDGSYYIPSLIEGTIKNGELTAYDKGYPTRVMSESTAAVLRNALAAVLTEGTGESAVPKATDAAGKTATAQTGKYSDKTEICQGWFCGFFPVNNPKYVTVVFSENTKKQAVSCGAIFAMTADGITEYISSP